MSDSKRIILALSGASGIIHARALLRSLAGAERVSEVHLVASETARRIAHDELGTKSASLDDLAGEWLDGVERRADVVVHPFRDVGAPMASGSFRHDGMVVCPCSTATLGAVAHGTSQNLIHRAADVTLKERRLLILMLRETPLSLVHLENMTTVARAGAVVMPLSAPWYHRPKTLDDLVSDTVDRALDHLGLPELVGRRWDGRSGQARG